MKSWLKCALHSPFRSSRVAPVCHSNGFHSQLDSSTGAHQSLFHRRVGLVRLSISIFNAPLRLECPLQHFPVPKFVLCLRKCRNYLGYSNCWFMFKLVWSVLQEMWLNSDVKGSLVLINCITLYGQDGVSIKKNLWMWQHTITIHGLASLRLSINTAWVELTA